MIIEMLLNDDIQLFIFVQIILNLQKKKCNYVHY
jgi:hypothetical protein